MLSLLRLPRRERECVPGVSMRVPPAIRRTQCGMRTSSAFLRLVLSTHFFDGACGTTEWLNAIPALSFVPEWEEDSRPSACSITGTWRFHMTIPTEVDLFQRAGSTEESAASGTKPFV